MSDPEPPFALTGGERRHPLWMKLKAHFELRLKAKLSELAQDHSETETANLRGQIKFLKAAIALGDDQPQITQ